MNTTWYLHSQAGWLNLSRICVPDFSGLAAVGLGLTMYWVDVRKKTAWAKPFEILGTNAIAAFFGSTLLAKLGYQIKWETEPSTTITLQRFLFTNLLDPWLPDYWASLAWAFGYVLLWLGVMWLLWRRRWFGGCEGGALGMTLTPLRRAALLQAHELPSAQWRSSGSPRR